MRRNRTIRETGGRQWVSQVWQNTLHRAKFGAPLVIVFLSGCSNDLVPVDATLRITPETHVTTVTEQRNADDRCLFFIDNYVDIPVLLQINTADGSPIGDAQVSVYADFASNTFPGFPVLALYDDLNGNGVVDAPVELISGPDDDIARVKTDTWTGARSLLLRVNLSCAFRGELFAFSGGVSGRASIEVVADNVVEEDPAMYAARLSDALTGDTP